MDLQSALVVCKLMDLSAHDVKSADAAVRSSFQRGQIDTDYVGLKSWDHIDSRSPSHGGRTAWVDPAKELMTWCYDFVSDDLNPVDSTFRVNERASRLTRSKKSSIANLLDELRRSTDEYFSRDTVPTIDAEFSEAYHAIIDLIGEEVARYQRDSDSWCSTGAFLGLVLTIVNRMPLPGDLLQTIRQLSPTDRERIFGD